MAVLNVFEDGRSRAGDETKSGRTYTRTFFVEFDSPDDGPLQAKAAVGIVRGDVYAIGNEADFGSYCQSVKAVCNSDDFLQYLVTVEYGPEEPITNPLNEPPTLTVSFTSIDDQIEYDYQNRPVVNTVGDPFAEMLTRKIYTANLTYTRNQLSYDPFFAWVYAGVVNSDYFLGAPPGYCRVVQIPGNSQDDENVGTYYTVSYEFEFNAFGFKNKVLNQGMRARDDMGLIRTVTNDDGVEISEPVLLNAQGKKLPPGAPPHYLEFQNYVTAPFSVFGIS